MFSFILLNIILIIGKFPSTPQGVDYENGLNRELPKFAALCLGTCHLKLNHMTRISKAQLGALQKSCVYLVAHIETKKSFIVQFREVYKIPSRLARRNISNYNKVLRACKTLIDLSMIDIS
ncbi:MAG: hypothetical protein JWQ09_1144 [Segetibacter sp.]|nr:hypothetical protein [Segetibacter sp.]